MKPDGSGWKLKHTSDVNGDVIEYAPPSEIIPGIIFDVGDGFPVFVVLNDVKVAYSEDLTMGTGNVDILGQKLLL